MRKGVLVYLFFWEIVYKMYRNILILSFVLMIGFIGFKIFKVGF